MMFSHFLIICFWDILLLFIFRIFFYILQTWPNSLWNSKICLQFLVSMLTAILSTAHQDFVSFIFPTHDSFISCLTTSARFPCTVLTRAVTMSIFSCSLFWKKWFKYFTFLYDVHFVLCFGFVFIKVNKYLLITTLLTFILLFWLL